MFIIFDYLSAHLQKSKNPQTYHNWVSINCGRLVKQKGPAFRTEASKSYKLSLKMQLMTISISWPSFITKLFSTQKLKSEMHSPSCGNIHQDIANFGVSGMV